MSTYDQHLEEPRQLERHDRDPDGESESEMEERAMRSRNARLSAALSKISEIVRIHTLYEGPPCNNARHGDHWEVAYVAHGEERVYLTLGDCRIIAKMISEHQAPESFTGEIVQAGDYAGGSHDSPCVVLLTTESQLSAIKQNLLGAKVRVTLETLLKNETKP